MQIIRFTYANTEIESSVQIMLFFKMMGVYVQERFYDLDITLKNRIGEFLFDEEEPLDLNRGKYDMDLFLAVDKEQEEMFGRYEQSEKTLLLLSGEVGNKVGRDGINKKKVLLYNRDELLFSLIQGMLENDIISKNTAEEFRNLARFFVDNKMADLLISTKCFFIPGEAPIYNGYYEKYRKAAQKLFDLWNEQQCHWGDERYMHLQFAALNIAYEGNAYCRRNQGSLLYSTEGLIRVCEILLGNEQIRFDIGNSLNLLLGNIYDNLTQSDKAYNYYLTACNEYNAYAYYKKACVLIDGGTDYCSSEKYLKRCLRIYPEYIRAWYALGLCYSHRANWEKAQLAWGYLRLVLQPRKREHVLNAMETEHLFLSSLFNGKIKQEKLMDFRGALYDYEYAKEVYDEISDTQFYRKVGMLEEENNSIMHMKKALFISSIYNKMLECYLQMGDIEHANEISRKLLW